MFNHHQNTKSNYNILSFIWQSAIDHPRNNAIKKRKERMTKVLLNVTKT